LPVPVAVRHLTFRKRVVVQLIASSFRLIIASLRVRATPRVKELIAARPTSSLIFMWHNRMLLGLSAFTRVGKSVPLTILISASRDGAIAEAVVQSFGMQIVRGSSSRRAVEATRELLTAVEAGRNVLITPDGPRGPIYSVKEGTAELARRHAPAIYVLGLKCSSVWQLKSWDKFMIPKPFSILELDAEKIESVDGFTVEQMQQTLDRLNQ
jgi:lysophospholipid acyltransferase (LPLAT)-like uncharacterized protein